MEPQPQNTTFDQAFDQLPGELMASMDKTQPDWHIHYAPQGALIDFARRARLSPLDQSSDLEDKIKWAHKKLREDTFQRIRDIVWLVGHSALGVEWEKWKARQ
jgi:hypothetical protein